jgi:hypothetical protein
VSLIEIGDMIRGNPLQYVVGCCNTAKGSFSKTEKLMQKPNYTSYLEV